MFCTYFYQFLRDFTPVFIAILLSALSNLTQSNGEKWEKAIEDFVERSVKYDLWCKMRFFGQQMQEAIDSDHRMVCRTGSTNLLVFVPDTFTQMDIQQVYLLQGKKGNLSALLNMWQKRGHIKKNMDGTYSKTEAFVLKYGHYGAPVAA